MKLINPEIRIETTNICNAHCIMCPREKLDREKGTMSIDLFKKIIDEVKDYGVEIIKGYSNFVHLKFPIGNDLELIVQKMKKKGYLIRTTGEGLPAVLKGCIRITVGPPAQMNTFIKELTNIIK